MRPIILVTGLSIGCVRIGADTVPPLLAPHAKSKPAVEKGEAAEEPEAPKPKPKPPPPPDDFMEGFGPEPETEVIRTANPPPPQPPPLEDDLFPKALPEWDDIQPPEGLPSGRPTVGLALTENLGKCYKEFFAERSVPPHVRRYGGRILMPDEEAIGPEIQCPSQRKELVVKALREAEVIE